MKLLALCITLLVSLAASAADAAPEQPAWRGIWAGTIGSQNIVACLDTADQDGVSAAAYYYLRHGKIISLSQADSQQAAWTEGSAEHQTGLLKLDAASGDHLTGLWSSPDGKKTAPLALTRLPFAPDEDSEFWWRDNALCRSVSFYGPRADAEQVMPGPTQQSENRHYRELFARSYVADKKQGGDKWSGNNTVELLDASQPVAGINQALRARWRTRLARSYVEEQGGLGDFFERVTWYSDRWLVLEEMEWTAGYGISGSTMWHETWNVKTGKKVDPWSWFGPKGGSWKPAESGPRAPPEFHPSAPLLRIVGRHYSADPDCNKRADTDDPRPSRQGLEFYSGFGPCRQVIVIPWRELLSFLNEEGTRAIKPLMDAKP